MSVNDIEEHKIVNMALSIIRNRIEETKNDYFNSSSEVKKYAELKLSGKKQEVFSGLLLDSQHRYIQYIEFFFGSIDSCVVYPREVVRACIELNASAIILMHNHPSGCVEPSSADENITKTLKNILKVVDVNVLDHLIVGHCEVLSFSEKGLMPLY